MFGDGEMSDGAWTVLYTGFCYYFFILTKNEENPPMFVSDFNDLLVY